MPNIKSAAKRMRQTVKSTARNKTRKSRISTARSNLDKAIQIDDKAKAETAAQQLSSALDKAVKSGVININKANRTKSRATKALAKMS